MLSLFVFGNTYDVYNTIKDIKFSFDKILPINTINILRENYARSLEQTYLGVNIYDNIDLCIEISDVILIIQNEKIPQKSIDHIMGRANFERKQTILINSPFSMVSQVEKLNNVALDYRRCPVILNLAIGTASHCQHIEFLLNKMFNELKIPIFQKYSSIASDLLNQFKGHNINLLVDNCNTDYEVIVISKVYNDVVSFSNDLHMFRNCYSDVVIVEIENNFDNINYLKKIIKINLGKEVDFIIRSRHKVIDKMICCSGSCKDNYDNERKNIFDIESIELYEKLRKIIINKITFPEGIVKL